MARAARENAFCLFLVFTVFSIPWSPNFSSFRSVSAAVAHCERGTPCSVPLVSRESRKIISSTESGTITAIDIDDGYRGPYHLQFFSLEPQSLLLPLLLHTDMVFYVHSGRGTVSWIDDEGETQDLEVESGDIYRIASGSVVYMRSHPDPMREKLRVYAIFTPTAPERSMQEDYLGAYSNVSDLVRGFDLDVLRAGFRVPAEVISGLKKSEKPPPIVPLAAQNETVAGVNGGEGVIGGGRPLGRLGKGKKLEKKKKKKKGKTKAFNIIKAEPDVENCNGRSIAVTSKNLDVLTESDIGVFMVNLTKGSMMGPHWNPLATEIAIVTHGRGMVQLVLPGNTGAPEETATAACQAITTLRFRVGVDDVFLVPRYHPMAQISFNDDYLSFVGFSTQVSQNHPQFLAGKRSVLQTLNRRILALSLGVPNTTVEQLLVAQEDAIMLECTSCAEQEERKMEAEIQKQKEEEARKREEEEEARRKEEEEARKREEEEEARRKEEEEARKREEEETRRREEEEARKREEEEEARKREEEEEATRKREEEEQARRQEEAAKKREEEEEEETKKEEEEEAGRETGEEEKRRQQEEEEEEEKRRQQEEEEARRQEERQRQGEQEEEEARGREEESPGEEMFKAWRPLTV